MSAGEAGELTADSNATDDPCGTDTVVQGVDEDRRN
jgi:hypothetical protein